MALIKVRQVTSPKLCLGEVESSAARFGRGPRYRSQAG